MFPPGFEQEKQQKPHVYHQQYQDYDAHKHTAGRYPYQRQ
jgi:hypothetical protein